MSESCLRHSASSFCTAGASCLRSSGLFMVGSSLGLGWERGSRDAATRASRRAAHFERACPVGRQAGIRFMLGLFVERTAQHGGQTLQFGKVLLFRAADRRFRQMIAKNEFGVDAVHCNGARRVVACFM